MNSADVGNPEAGRRRKVYPRKRRKKDTEFEKRFPNSLAATLRTIRLMSDCSSPTDFATELQPSFARVMQLYPGSNHNPTGLKGIIERNELGKSDIRYYVLRSYAEHLGIPTSLLLLFSHVIGHISRNKPHRQVTDVLDGMIRAAEVLRELVNNAQRGGDALIEFPPGATPNEGRYNVNTAALTKVVRAYTYKPGRSRKP